MKKYLPIITITAVTAILVTIISKMLGGESESNLPLFVSVTILPILYLFLKRNNNPTKSPTPQGSNSGGIA